MSEHTVVIGSGFGGAAAATRLALAGQRVTLVERGPWRDTLPVRSMGIAARSPLPQGPGAWRRLLWAINHKRLPRGRLNLNRAGLFELFVARGLHVVCSAGVGGGSHVYSGLNLRPPDPAYWDGIATGLSAGALEPSYARVLDRMGARAPMADDRLPHRLQDRFDAGSGLDTTGADTDLAMGLAFPQTPGAARRICTAEGIERWEARPGMDGNLGSPGGGKTTLDFAFLHNAMKAGLTVLDRCEVTLLQRSGEHYSVALVNHHTGTSETLDASRVVLAAGTMNTLRLLLASEAAGGLAPMAGLGDRFGGNGDYVGYWQLDDAGRDLTRSMPARGILRPGRGDDGTVADWPMLVEGALVAPEALPLGRWAARLLRSGSFIAGMGADAQNGRVSWHKGRMQIDYRAAESPIYARLRQAFRDIGARTGKNVLHFATPITVHPTGGACIGADPGSGVIDAAGEVFANPGLYVADAAALPKPVAGPPSMTIAAWADYLAGRLLEAD